MLAGLRLGIDPSSRQRPYGTQGEHVAEGPWLVFHCNTTCTRLQFTETSFGYSEPSGLREPRSACQAFSAYALTISVLHLEPAYSLPQKI